MNIHTLFDKLYEKKNSNKLNVVCFYFLFLSLGRDTCNDINNARPQYAIAGTIKLILASLSTFVFSSISPHDRTKQW